CVGSSATLGSGDEAATDLTEYAETIFGEKFDENAVVRETRKSPSEVFGPPEYLDWPEPQVIQTALLEAEQLDQSGAARRMVDCQFADGADPDLEELRAGDPAHPAWRILLGKVLLEHHICQRVLKHINEADGPSSRDQLANELGQAKAIRDWE